MPETTRTDDPQDTLRVLETSTDPRLTDLLAAMTGPLDDIELSPDYFYNWANWSKN